MGRKRTGGWSAGRSGAALALVGVVVASGCALPPEDAVAADVVGEVLRVVEGEAAGRVVPSRAVLRALVLDARPAVEAGLDGGFAPGTRRMLPFDDQGRTVPDDAALAVAVWDQRTGPDPFTDDRPRWHVTCARVSVDVGGARLRAAIERCPDEVPQVPVEDVALLGAPDEDAVAGTLRTGDRPRQGEPTEPARPLAAAEATAPCLAEDLAATLGSFSTTAGGRDTARLRVLNTGHVDCTLGTPGSLRLAQGAEGASVSLRGSWRGVALRPLESAAADLTWTPEAVDDPDVQRVTLVLGVVEVAVVPGAGTPLVSLPVSGGVAVDGRGWRVVGYGGDLDDDRPAVDVAPACVVDRLGARIPAPATGSADPPPGPVVELVNLGVRSCRLVAGAPVRVDGGVPTLVPPGVVDLRPGEVTAVPAGDPVSPRPGELLVRGAWVRTR